jgi:hypothetical protein
MPMAVNSQHDRPRGRVCEKRMTMREGFYCAQYFQTAPTVTSGPVKATVTFDVFYQ